MNSELKELMNKTLALNPYSIVKCGLDGFRPFAYLHLPDDMDRDVRDMPYEDILLWDAFCADYVRELANNSGATTLRYMKLRYHLD